MFKILIATPLFPPDIGGPATYSKLLAEELHKEGIEVRVLTFGEVRKFPKILRHFAYFWKVLTRGWKTDVIFALDPVSVGLPAMLAAKLLRKRFLIKIVGDYAWEQGTQRFGVEETLDDFLSKKYGRRVEFLRSVERIVARRAEKIITPSVYLKKVVARWGIKEEKITVIYNAFVPSVDLVHLSDESKADRKIGLGLKARVIVSAGRLVPWKGFSMLIDLMPDLLREFPDLQLVIIGGGPGRNALEIQAGNLGLKKDAVFFTGEVHHFRVFDYLRAADVFVLNSAYEGFSHQLLEAMAMGTLILTTDAGGNPELIQDGKTGFLFKFNDRKALRERIINIFSYGDYVSVPLENKMAQIYEIGPEYQKYAENAARKVREFSYERMLKETLKIISNL